MVLRKEKLLVCLVFALFFSLIIPGFYCDQVFAGGDPIVNIADITRIEGARNNQLVGYGLVTGLDGSGDSTRSQATVQSISNMLSQFGVEVDPDQVQGRNIAAVMVTADLPHDANTGDQIDVQVSSIGDAGSLEGGTLVRTPLEAATGEIYAVAQGSVSVGGFGDDQDHHPTSARVPGGAIVERTIDYRLDREELTFILRNGNFRTASSIVDTINEHFSGVTGGMDIAYAENESRVAVEVPDDFQNNIVEFIAEINDLEVQPTMTAKVVVNERTGTVVKGHNVRISTVSVSHGDLSVNVLAHNTVEDDTGDEPFLEQQQEMEVEDSAREEEVMVIEGGSNINDLVAALNAIGADSNDLIAILQEIKAAGALHAELEIR